MSWGKAVDAAWRAFGIRYWRVIVGLSLAARALPVLAAAVVVGAVVAGVWWLVRHVQVPNLHVRPAEVPPLDWLWWALAGLALVAAVVVARRLANPYRSALTMGPGRWLRRLGVVTTAAALVLLAWVWKG